MTSMNANKAFNLTLNHPFATASVGRRQAQANATLAGMAGAALMLCGNKKNSQDLR